MIDYNFRDGLLPYPLSYLPSEGGLVTDVFDDGDLANTLATKNWYVLCLTGQEMIDLQSLIALGAPIAFPETYNDTIQTYMQLTQFPNEIPEGSCMDLCQLIIDCINDTEALQELIQITGRGSGMDGTSDTDTVIEGTLVIGDTTGCDTDKLFGAITGMVDLMNATAEDIIEIWNAAVNDAARIGDMIEAIPIIGEAPFDDILQMSETFLQDLADNYLASYTVALRNEYRCDLLCLMIDDCNFTLLDVYDYFNDRLTVPLSLTDVNSFVSLMITQPDTGTLLVDAFHTFMIATVIFGGEVAGIDQDLLVKMVSALFNDPDNDWDGLCDDCLWTYTIDFTADDGIADGFDQTVGEGWVNGLGYKSLHLASPNLESNYIYCTLGADAEITYVKWTFASTDQTNFATGGAFNLGGALLLDAVVGTAYVLDSSGQAINASHIMYNATGEMADVIRTTNNPKFIGSGKWYITDCEIRGIGANPFA